MTKTTYLITTPDGATHKRTSDSRLYTHAVVGRHDYQAALASAQKLNKMDGQNFQYYIEVIAGTHEHAQKHSWETDEQHANNRAADIARKTAEIAGCTDAQAYMVMKRDQAVAHVEAQKAAGYYDTFGALTWCGRPDLAAKQVAKHAGYYLDVQAIPVTVKGAK
jgi:hypothetical protein